MLVHETYVGPVPLNIVAAAAARHKHHSRSLGLRAEAKILAKKPAFRLEESSKTNPGGLECSTFVHARNFKLGSPRLVLTSDFAIVLHANRKLHHCQQARL
jgi:hypothetical protein